MGNASHRTEVLISAAQIQARIAELGQAIARAHTGRRLVCVGVLKGSFMFLADLVRAIPLPELEVDFIGVSSYAGTESTGTWTLARAGFSSRAATFRLRG